MKICRISGLALSIAGGHTVGNIDNETGNTDSSISNKHIYLWYKTESLSRLPN